MSEYTYTPRKPDTPGKINHQLLCSFDTSCIWSSALIHDVHVPVILLRSWKFFVFEYDNSYHITGCTKISLHSCKHKCVLLDVFIVTDVSLLVLTFLAHSGFHLPPWDPTTDMFCVFSQHTGGERVSLFSIPTY